MLGVRICPGGTNSEGAARWLATGPENQGDRKVRGSIPPPSARRAQPVRLPGLPAKQCVPDRVSGSCPGLSAISARVAQRQCTALVRRRSRIIPERGLREGKAGGSGSRSVKPILNRERIETSPSHHALLGSTVEQPLNKRPTIGSIRQGVPVRGSVIQRQNSWLLTSL